MAKKRVYDLAKQYGMTGQELAAKLRDLGFPVKSHMSALDDFQVLEIQARLEAYGIVGESTSQSPVEVGGLKIKRRKKKKTVTPAKADEPPGPGSSATEAPATELPDEESTQERVPRPRPAAEDTLADPRART